MLPCRADYIFIVYTMLNFSSHLALLLTDSRYTFPLHSGLGSVLPYMQSLLGVPPNLNSFKTTHVYRLVLVNLLVYREGYW